MHSSPVIVVIGSSNTDLVVRVPHIPAPGETILGGSLLTAAGGKGANQAVAAARMGGKVTFLGRVGDDSFGESARENLHADGIDTRYVAVTPGVASGIALITVQETTGQNAIVVAPGANGYLCEADIEEAASAFDTAQAVVASLEVPLPAVERAAEMACIRRIPFILNPAPARPLPQSLLTQVTVLTPNETEAAQLLGIAPDSADPAEIAGRLLELGVTSAVLTVGSAGALSVTPDGVEHIPGFPVQAIDTVAAGDCFTGALAVEFAAGKSLRDAVQFANAAAALKVTRRGAQPGIPDRAEVEAFLQSRS